MEQGNAPAPLPPGISFISFDGAPAEPAGKLICLTVAYGDTLSGIAALFGSTVADIARINAIDNPDRIFPGQRLILRVPATVPIAACEVYTVKRGDTLSGIAGRLGLSLAALANANPQLIQPGQALNLP